MRDDKLRHSLEELFSGISPLAPEGEARPLPSPPPPVEEPPPEPEVVQLPPEPEVVQPPPEPEAVQPPPEPEVEVEPSPFIGGAAGESLLSLMRVTRVRSRLIGGLLVVLSLLGMTIILNFASLDRLERAMVALQNDRTQADVALEVSDATVRLLSVLERGMVSEDEAYFTQTVAETRQELLSAQERLAVNISALPADAPLRLELIRLRDCSNRVRALADFVLQRVEEGDWETVGQPVQSGLIHLYRDRVADSMERVEMLAAEREAASLAEVENARRMERVIPVVWGLLIMGAGLVTTVDAVRCIARPVERLTKATTRLAAGHLGERVSIEQADEFGDLATAFNEMADRIQAAHVELEERVAERTRALQEANYALQRRAIHLETSAEVGRAITSVFDVEQLLRRTVDLIRDRFGFYHAGIFLLDQTGEWAVLQEATGEAGALMKAQGHRLALADTSMVGWTALHRQPRIALDVGEDAVHFANPLLPYTRSEMTLPLMVGGRLLGVLDVQSTEEAAFDDDDVRVLQSMANQIAIAIENARRISDEAALLEATSPIYRASRRLTTALSVEEVVDVVITSVADAGATGCLIGLFEPPGSDEPEVIHFVGAWSQEQPLPLQPGTRAPVKEGPLHHRNVSSPWTVTDMAQATHLPERTRVFLHRLRARAVTNVPLQVGERVVGFVTIYRTVPAPFSEATLRLYETLGDQVAVALERVRLLEVTSRRAEDEATLRAIGDRIAQALDIKTVVHSAAEGLSEALQAAGVYIELGPGLATLEGPEPVEASGG